MGGQNETVVKSSSPQSRRAAAFSSKPGAGQISVRIHNNTQKGEVHFHDDANKIKVAVPAADFWEGWNAFKKNPYKAICFVDPVNQSQVTIVLADQSTNGMEARFIPQLDLNITVQKIELGTNYRAMDDFVQSK